MNASIITSFSIPLDQYNRISLSATIPPEVNECENDKLISGMVNQLQLPEPNDVGYYRSLFASMVLFLVRRTASHFMCREQPHSILTFRMAGMYSRILEVAIAQFIVTRRRKNEGNTSLIWWKSRFIPPILWISFLNSEFPKAYWIRQASEIQFFLLEFPSLPVLRSTRL